MRERFYPPIDRAASRAEGPLEKRGGSGKVRLPLPPEGGVPQREISRWGTPRRYSPVIAACRSPHLEPGAGTSRNCPRIRDRTNRGGSP